MILIDPKINYNVLKKDLDNKNRKNYNLIKNYKIIKNGELNYRDFELKDLIHERSIIIQINKKIISFQKDYLNYNYNSINLYQILLFNLKIKDIKIHYLKIIKLKKSKFLYYNIKNDFIENKIVEYKKNLEKLFITRSNLKFLFYYLDEEEFNVNDNTFFKFIYNLKFFLKLKISFINLFKLNNYLKKINQISRKKNISIFKNNLTYELKLMDIKENNEKLKKLNDKVVKLKNLRNNYDMFSNSNTYSSKYLIK